jgi:hypothetical protein
VPPVDEVLRLDLVPVARRGIEAEVRQALRPRPRDPEDRQVVGGGVDEPHRAWITAGTEELFRDVGCGGVDPALDPRGVQRLAAPVGEQAHAVGGVHDRV